MTLLLGYDVGSSSIQAMLMDAETGRVVASSEMTEKELEIIAKNPDWAERHARAWWDDVITTTQKIKSLTNFVAEDVKLIAISYQTHGFIAIDKGRRIFRNVMLFHSNNVVKVGNKGIKNGKKNFLIRKKRKCYWWFDFVLFMAVVITLISICTAMTLSFCNPHSMHQRDLQGALFETCSTTWKMGVGVILGLLSSRIYRRH